MMRLKIALVMVLNCYDGKTAEKVVHIVPEPMGTIYLVQAVPQTSPFINIFYKKTLDISEAGFFKYIRDKEQRYLFRIQIQRYRNWTSVANRDEVPIRLENLHLPFTFLVLMWLSAIFVFVIELLCAKRGSLKPKTTIFDFWNGKGPDGI